jgi:ATP-binding cassette subfamily B protein
MKALKSYFSIKSFLSFMGRYKLRIGIVFVSFVIADIFIALFPVFIGKLIGSLSAHPIDQHQAYVYAVYLIICSTGHSLMWHVSELLYLKLLNPLSFKYENILFKQVINKPYHYFVDKFTGKISSYITTISQEFRDQQEKLFWDYANHVIQLIAIAIILTAVNWQTGMIFVFGLASMLLIGRHTIRNSIKYEKIWTDVQATKNGRIVDAVANFANIKSFQKEKTEGQAIEAEQEKVIRASGKSFIWTVVFWGSMGFIIRNFIWPVTILLNVYLFIHHRIDLTALTTFLSAVVLFSNYIWEIIWNLSQFTLKLARVEEAHTYLFGKTNVAQEYFARTMSEQPNLELHDQLEFRRLNFAYPDKQAVSVLKDINLVINKGEKIGIVGRSGGGKTTLTKLLLGYYSMNDDTILLDGQPVDNSDLASLISFVPQDTSLFHRSIADNIAYATDRKVTRSEIIQAAKHAHAHEFIETIEQQYDALVGERGVKLSAGQRQRIAIARAFLDNKPILILDEATSALDSESEILVQQALEDLWQHKTVIAIAHRLSTLRNMDKIIVLQKGTIAEQGTHEHLLKHGEIYANLWAHQSGGFLED